MRIAIFGATGSVGRHLVDQALQAGHEVTAFSRNPESLAVSHDRLRIVRGDVRLLADVNAAVEGQDAVFCTLGAGRDGSLRSEGTRNIVDAMLAAGVRRFICQTTLGAGDSAGNLTFFWKYIMFGLLLRAAFADHERQEAIVRDSSLDWTIVRPGAFTDGPLTGQYRSGFSGSDKNLKLKISRADVAHFLLRVLDEKSGLHSAISVSN
ncbi:MAG: SDR family oxidoreductase [Gammaproteobacteria bacterium]|nr:SDR family oxidoreductase [Gammaproteobacteria bacterium]